MSVLVPSILKACKCKDIFLSQNQNLDTMSLLIQFNGKQILLKTVQFCFHFSEIKKLRNIEINDFSVILQIFGFLDFFKFDKN